MSTKLNQVFPALQADDGFVITPSDSGTLLDDLGNTKLYGQVVLKNNSSVSGYAHVTTVHDTELTLYILAGAVEPIAVKKVWADSTDITPLVGYVGHQKV